MARPMEWDELCHELKCILKFVYFRLALGGLRVSKMEAHFGDDVELIFFPVNEDSSPEAEQNK